MDKELLSYAYLLQSGYTHKELKTFLIDECSTSALFLWEKTKSGNFPDLTLGRKEKIQKKLQSIDESRIKEFLEKNSVDIITQKDLKYPKNLKSIGHSPAFLYVKGHLDPGKSLLGVVGSRKHTSYAKEILTKILPDIVHAGFGIVSGGATGVDTLGHELCIKEDGYTVVVLGTGIDISYPSRNREFFEKIIHSQGAIISHFPLGTGPEQYNFPMRNEMVAALSKGIVIPEAGLSSGTLITAQLALEHGRDVFAVPGDIHRPTSEGTNMLIATGQAKCVRCAGDILEEYFDVKSIGTGMTPIVKTPPVFSNVTEKLIYESIESGYMTVDELIYKSGFELTELLSHTALLELKGHIRIDEMGRYQVK